MRILDKARLRLRSLHYRTNVDVELEAELRFHLDQLMEENVSSGMPPEEARRAAQRMMGGLAQYKEECRDMRRVNFAEDLVQDVRYTIRSLAKSWGFTAVVVATLALGIGANIAIFTIVHGVLLRPLDYPKPNQLMYLTAETSAIGSSQGALSAPEYIEFREMNRSFAEVGAYSTGGTAYTTGEVNLTAGDRPLRVRSISVDSHLLKALGIQPEQGRFFEDEETTRWTGSLPPPIAILSDELWRTVFGGRPLVGQKVEIDGRLHEIVGVMPPGADVMDHHTQVWLPLWLPPTMARQRETHILYVIARRKNGIAAKAAQMELSALLKNWGGRAGTRDHVPTSHPVHSVDHTLRLWSLQDATIGDASRPIWILQAAVGFVLFIVCANLANLVMARAGSRRCEFVLRGALGASRGRLLRQSLTEGAVMAGAGGILGLSLASAGVRGLVRAYPESIPRASDVTIDLPVLLVAFGLSVATALLFGFVSLGRRRTSSMMTALKEGARTARGSWRHYARRGLVVAQVAFAVMLVIGAGLLVRTVYNLTRIDAGFDRSRLVTFSMTLPMANSEPETRAHTYQRILDRLRSVPGVLGTAAMSGLPPDRTPDAIATPIENYISDDGKPFAMIDYYQFVMGDYFGTMGIPIVAGRGFERNDNASQGKVVIVNETLAKRIWNGQNPIGHRLRPPGSSFGADDNAWHTVIGVAKDVRQRGVERPAGTELYISLDQHDVAPPSMNVAMRTTLPPAALSRTIERMVGDVAPGVPVVRLRDMDSVFAESIRRPALLAQLLGAFAGLALLLVAIGTYGVLSYMVTERRREIGIRVALGATRSHVLTEIIKQGLQVTTLGIIIGLAGALAVNRLMASLLFGVQPTDTMTFALVVATITAVAVVASWLPAWRASRLDPNVVLRDE
ncbi:MAG TPA: ABC transporter permease [Acidobacteriaceae bacterium]|nr:ABC transporter permease [Acidobacteriaceae bacterium]